MFDRLLESHIQKLIKQYKCITLIGPRQSGKTTLAKKLFPNFQYFTFESPDSRDAFESDPRGFLKGLKGSCIFDEVQKLPIILSYLQEVLDDKADQRRFILTGSNNLQLSSKVSQTLSGRTAILKVLPLQREEIPVEFRKNDMDNTLLYGSYPRIYDEQLDPTFWFSNYYQTYVERDVRDTINITDLSAFNNFVRLLAGRVGQLVNYNSLGGDAGISQPTAKSWLSAMETTFICFRLQPHFKNFSKRIIKAPKIYFYDTGLLCYILRVKSIDELATHPLKGAVFENWVIAEQVKQYYNRAEEVPLYFWRDQHGHEVDLVVDNGQFLELIEIKMGQTFQKDFLKNMKWLNQLQGIESGKCIYGGDKKFEIGGYSIVPWGEYVGD